MGRDLRGRGVAIAVAILFLGACGGGPRRTDHTPGAMPPGETFTGVWFSPQYGELELTQTGTAVVGEYHKDQRRGRIQGRVVGNLLRFSWTEQRELVSGMRQTLEGHGYFRLVVGDDGRTNALGEWGVDADEVGGGVWNAYRLRNRMPGDRRRNQGSGARVTPFDTPEASTGPDVP